MERTDDEDMLVLSDELPVSDEAGVTLSLLSSENTLHGIDPTRKTIVEGHISFDPRGDLIFFIPPFAGEEPLLVPDREQWDLYLVNLPFALHPASGNRYYKQITFRIELTTPDAFAYNLFPDAFTDKAREKVTYIFSPWGEFLDAEIYPTQRGKRLQFTSLRPRITSFGKHESTFYWLYEGDQEQQAIKPEMKQAIIVLQVPHNTPFVEGKVSVRALIVKKLLGRWEQKEAFMKEHPIRWELHNAPKVFKTTQVSVPLAESSATPQMRAVINLYYSFASEKADTALVKEFQKHFAPLIRQGRIHAWDRSKIISGQVIRAEMTKQLNIAHIILLFISPDYLASQDCVEEMEQALARHVSEAITVVPILLRPIAQAEEASFAQLQVFPRGKRALSELGGSKASMIASMVQEIIMAFNEQRG